VWGGGGALTPTTFAGLILVRNPHLINPIFRGHIEDVYDLAWSPNATQLISGSVDNSVIIWDTNKGMFIFVLRYLCAFPVVERKGGEVELLFEY
jgi:WD40 repeat protein